VLEAVSTSSTTSIQHPAHSRKWCRDHFFVRLPESNPLPPLWWRTGDSLGWNLNLTAAFSTSTTFASAWSSISEVCSKRTKTCIYGTECDIVLCKIGGGGYTFNWAVQVYQDEYTTPLNDSTVEWPVSRSLYTDYNRSHKTNLHSTRFLTKTSPRSIFLLKTRGTLLKKPSVPSCPSIQDSPLLTTFLTVPSKKSGNNKDTKLVHLFIYWRFDLIV